MDFQPPRACLQRCQFGWYGISFQPGQEKDVLDTFKEVTLEVNKYSPELVIIRIDNNKYEDFVKLVMERCHFSTPLYFTAGIMWGPEVAQEEAKPDPGTKCGA